jgi:hypothetical protein
MKKLIIFLGLLMPLFLSATVITSKSTTGAWTSASTWIGGVVPGSTDSVIIATTGGHDVNLNTSATVACVTVNSGAILELGSLTVTGLFTNNGNVTDGSIYLTANSGTVLTGSGTWTSTVNQSIYFTGANQVIDASVNFNPTIGGVIMNTSGLAGNVKVTNNGSVALSNTTDGEITNNDATIYSSTWINAANSFLEMSNASLTASRDTLYASASGNTVEYNNASATTLKKPISGTYYNLNLNGAATFSLPAATTVSGNLTIGSSATLDVTTSNYALSVAGNFTDNNNFTQRSGTVTFNGSANQQLNGSHTPTFYNLTENQAATNDSTFFNAAVTVSNTLTTTSGILDCQKHQLSNSATPAVSLSPASATICNGDATTLTASSYSSYVWSPSTGLSATTGSSVTANPTSTTTYTVYGNNSHTYTCGTNTDPVTVDLVTTTCSGAVHLTHNFDTDYAFQACESTLWFSFVADSTKMIIEITRPVSATDTPFVRVDSLILYSGSCGSLSGMDTSVNNHVSLNDTLPQLYVTNLIIGHTYYLKVTRYHDAWKNYSSYFGLQRVHILHNLIPSCSLSACDTTELLYNHDFENVPAWDTTVGGHIAYRDNSYIYHSTADAPPQSTYAIASPNMRFEGYIPESSPFCYSYLDATDVYWITSYLSSNYYNKAEDGHYFMLVDCSSAACHYCYSDVSACAKILNDSVNGLPYVSKAWEQKVKTVVGAKYVFSAYLRNADSLYDCSTCRPLPSATVWISIDGTTYYLDQVDTTYKNWKKVCFNWVARPADSIADIIVCGAGASNSAGYDFELDNLSFKYAELPSISVDTAIMCAGSSGVTLSVEEASPLLNYSWSPSTGLSATTGATVTASPTVTTTYTVTESYGACSDSTAKAVVIYDAHCCSPNCTGTAGSSSGTHIYAGGLTISSGSSSTYGSDPVTFSGCGSSSVSNSFTINGTFTINNKSIFRDVNVAMGTYAKIVVDTLDTLIINNARFYACDTMWDGIVVNPGGTIIVDTNSIIEDALIAIEAKSIRGVASNITVVNSTLNNDSIGIKVDTCAFSAAYPLELRNATFTTSADPFSPNPYLKVPHAGIIGRYGVYLDSVRGTTFGKEAITIGDPASAAYLNHFSNIQFGVYALNSNFAVFNNNFSELEGRVVSFGPSSTIGVAVYANATDYDTTKIATFFTAIVGSSGLNYPNTIYNCYRGVDVTEYTRLQVDSNYFLTIDDTLNVAGKRPYGDHAVYFKTEGHDSIQFAIDKNTIENFNTGIHVLGLTPTGLTNINTGSTRPACYINSNYIHANSINILSEGIQVENLYSPTSGQVEDNLFIQNNKIDSAQYCIYLNELYNSWAYVSHNPDLYVMPSIKTSSTLKAAVYVTASQDAPIIEDNGNIHADGTYIGAAAAADSSVVGIYVYLSPDIYLCSNHLYNLGQDIKFVGSCINSQLYNNSIDTAYDGFVLDLNGVISQQGSSTAPVGNIWGDSAYMYHSQTYTSSSPKPYLNSPLYLTTASFPVKNKTTGVPITDSYGAPGALNSASGTIPSCQGNNPGIKDPHPLHGASSTGVDTTALVNQMKAIIGDSLGNGYTLQSEYIMKQQVYEMLGNCQSLQNKDTALAGFYNRNSNTNIGYISFAEQQIRSGNIAGARATNSLIIPQNQIEQNHKDVNTVLLNTYGSGIDSGTSNQISSLQSIATQCPVLGGTAVFKARTLLNALLNTSILYTDSCAGGSPGHRKTEKPIANASMQTVMVYPNPASTLLSVQIQLQPGETVIICLYNNLGEEVKCEVLKTNLSTVSITNLAEGIYYYRVIDNNGNLIKSDKIMVIR